MKPMPQYDTGNNFEKRFIFLIGQIPNWEVYLTDKQLESAKVYIGTLSTTLTDYKLNLSPSTSGRRLFGSSDKTGVKSKGALGRLEDVYLKLDKMGFFKKIEPVNKDKYKTKSILSDKTLEKVKELFKIVTDLEDYSQYLSEIQSDKLYQFLKSRSFKECAKYYDINETTFKQSILGRDDDSGILGKLRKAYDEKHISNWDDL